MNDIFENWNKFVLNESSLSRLHRHISAHETAIITAFRNDPTDASDCTGNATAPSDEQNAYEMNKERNRQLKAALLRKGYGVTRVDGSYIEDFGDIDKQKEVSEESFFVVNLKIVLTSTWYRQAGSNVLSRFCFNDSQGHRSLPSWNK